MVKSNRIEWLASLRGLLVLLVFCSHITLFTGISKDLAFVIGRIGVAGFFIISGFLAVTSIAKRNAKQYLFNRFLRIYPIFWFLLLCVYLLSSDYGVIDLVKNAALVSKSMIGSSWMLPIMVFLFIVLTVICKFKINYYHAFYVLLAGCLLLGIGRFLTGFQLPTAFFLLSALGVLSFIWQSHQACFKSIKYQLYIYEVVLVVAAVLSYGDKAVWYFVAYNLGGAIFVLFRKYNLRITLLEFFGRIGFTFFLGAGIPMMVLSILAPNLDKFSPVEDAIIRLILTIPFSWLITRYMEQPLLRWGKRIEKKIH